MKEVAADLQRWLAEGRRVALATVVRVTGSAPRPPGATLVATAGDQLAGSVSNGCVEAAVYEEAMATLADGRPRIVHYGISDELAFTVGLSCGGSIDVLIEPIGPLHERALAAITDDRAALLVRVLSPADRAGTLALLDGDRWVGPLTSELAAIDAPARAALGQGLPRTVGARLADGREATIFLEALPRSATLVVIGATHIGIVLARLANDIGLRVIVADPRAALADRARFPGADEILLAWPDEALSRVRVDERTAIVLLSHDPKFDRPGLAAALRGRAGYVGAIGSRRTNVERFAWLREQGFGDEDLARVHAPVGLDIGARTAEEIALAILAEIVAVFRGRPGASLSRAELVSVA